MRIWGETGSISDGRQTMHIIPDYDTLEAFSDAVRQGVVINLIGPGVYTGLEPDSGEVYVIGPHAQTNWWAYVVVDHGRIMKVL